MTNVDPHLRRLRCILAGGRLRQVKRSIIQMTCTNHHPTGAQEDDHAEDVDHARRKDAIPRAEEHRLGDEEICLPPRLALRRLHHKQSHQSDTQKPVTIYTVG